MKNLKTATSSMLLALMVSAQAQTPNFPVPVLETEEPMETGAFEPTWESLSQYEVPEWYKNAKFGMWAHWGPQCVEGSGDWMARSLYQEGSHAYKYHVEHYGHPSEVGFKDILPLFKAENWNPKELVNFYKSIGAQYFFVLGNHHDNFDLWDSKYQPWNSMNIGPKRDILAEWAEACQEAGLPLGISFHADHAWTWYEPSRRYDRSGDKMGVPYDGWLTKEDGYKPNADGSEKWWKGLDPQELYGQNHPLSEGTWADGMIHRQWGWGNGAATPSQAYVTNFYNRTLDAINRYNPDLIYFDVTVLPFYPVSDAGLKITAHMYNHSMNRNGGKNRAVVFGKILENDQQRSSVVWDVERGAPNSIQPEVWQCDNCIGGWHYNTSIYENSRYKSAHSVAKLLVDIVSKNGNMVLNVPLRADGTFDEKEHAILQEFGAWMQVNSECIFDTRPWQVFGEGPIADSDIQLRAQGFNDGQYEKADSREIRFTQKGKVVYAAALAWPENRQMVIRSMAKGSKYWKKGISSIELLGYGRVKYTRTADALIVTLPETACNTLMPVLKIK